MNYHRAINLAYAAAYIFAAAVAYMDVFVWRP